MRCFRVSFSPVCLMSVHKRSICLRHNRETQRERIQEEHIFKPRLTGAWGSWNRFSFTSFRKKQLHCHLIQIYLFICSFYWNRSCTRAGPIFSSLLYLEQCLRSRGFNAVHSCGMNCYCWAWHGNQFRQDWLSCNLSENRSFSAI